MGQSVVKNNIDIVFSTKHRQRFISGHLEDELYAYLGGIRNRLACPPIKVGGYSDHVHILCLLSKSLALAKLFEDVKSHSSKWAKTKGDRYKNFYWQDGYGAFSVNPSEIQVVVDYISRQKEHHLTRSFQEEYRAFLKEYGVEYDERYVWDSRHLHLMVIISALQG